MRIGDVVIEGGLPEFAAATEALFSKVRAQRVSVAALYRLAEAIEKLYSDAGYSLIRVTLPPQELNDGGTLHLIVLDGFIESIDASAVPERARARVEAVLQKLIGRRRVSSDELERALTLAGRGPGLTLRSAMGPGTVAGGVALVLQGEFKRFGASWSADNRLSKSFGPWQSTVQMTLNEALGGGGGEQAYLYISHGFPLTQAFGRNAPRWVAGGGMIFPVGTDGLTVNPEVTWSDTQPPPQALVPGSRSRLDRLTLRLTYPWILTRQQELNLTASLEASDQIDTLPAFDFTLSEDRLRVARVGTTWSTSTATGGRLNAGATFSQGIATLSRTEADANASGIALSRAGARPGFQKLEANVTLDEPLPFDIQSRTVARVQAAINGVLPGAELFSLTGEDALSSYTSGGFSDDAGWLLRQEYSRSFSIAALETTAMPYVFLAAGKTYSETPGAPTGQARAAYGVGVRSYWSKAVLSMEYARRPPSPGIIAGSQLFLKAQVQF